MDNNDLLIDSFPKFPSAKQYNGQVTDEQMAFLRNRSNKSLSKEDEKVLAEAVGFYNESIPHLKKFNLSDLSDLQALKVLTILKNVFNLHLRVYNEILTDCVFRVTIVKDEFCENGKIRDTRFIKYPSLEVNKANGLYNRANSPEKTVMYASFFKNVAIRETKPKVGERIIISSWENIQGAPFTSFPITNASLPVNAGVTKSTRSFKELCLRHHPLMAELMNCYLSFFAEEFIKDTPIISSRRFEYLFSAFFADKSLIVPPKGRYNVPDIDFLIYPSVACGHKHDNIAIRPEVVEARLKPVYLREYKVVETYYESATSPLDIPAKLESIRESQDIWQGRIRWRDD